MSYVRAAHRPSRTPFNLRSAPLDDEQLARIQHGGDQLLDAILALQKKQHSVLSYLLPQKRAFTLWDHSLPAR